MIIKERKKEKKRRVPLYLGKWECLNMLHNQRAWPKRPNTIIGRNMQQSTIVYELYRDIPLFWNSNSSNSSLSCNSSFGNLSSIKNCHHGRLRWIIIILKFHLELKLQKLEFLVDTTRALQALCLAVADMVGMRMLSF